MAPVFFLLLILFTVGFTFATSAVNVLYDGDRSCKSRCSCGCT